MHLRIKHCIRLLLLSVKNAIDKFRAAKELSLIRKNNLGSFFSFINRRLKSNIASVGLKMDDQSMTTDPSTNAEIFNKFFGSVFTVNNGLCPDVNTRAVDDGLGTIPLRQRLLEVFY